MCFQQVSGAKLFSLDKAPKASSGELLCGLKVLVPMIDLVQMIWDKFLRAVQPIMRLEYFGSEDPEDLNRPWKDFPGQCLQELEAAHTVWLLAPCQAACPDCATFRGGIRSHSELLRWKLVPVCGTGINPSGHTGETEASASILALG